MGITKAIMAGSFDFGTPAIKLAKVHSRGVDRDWIVKSSSVMTAEMDAIRPEKGHAFVHVIALGDSEKYGFNRNGDGFPKQANQTYHHTFVTHGRAYAHHQNKNPDKAEGTVKASAYNDEMSRVELLLKVREDAWHDELEKLANDGMPGVSMSCRVPYDTCSVSSCRNKAHTRDEYCVHLRDHITKIAADGTHIGAINDHPTFFDISRVHRNADRIAFGLRKVASAIICGADLAEELGIGLPAHLLINSSKSDSVMRKLSTLTRLAAMDKEVMGVIKGKKDRRGVSALADAVPTRALKEAEVAAFHRADPNKLFGALAKEAVLLPIQDFYRVIYGPKYPEIELSVEKAAECLPGIFAKMAEDKCPMDEGNYDADDGPISSRLKELIGQVAREISQNSKPGTMRISMTIIKGNKPKLQADKAQAKEASDESKFLAKEFAKYAVAYLSEAGPENEALTVLTSLRNFVN